MGKFTNKKKKMVLPESSATVSPADVVKKGLSKKKKKKGKNDAKRENGHVVRHRSFNQRLRELDINIVSKRDVVVSE